MSTPSFLEDHVSQIPAIQLLITMGYVYVTPEEALAMRGGKTSHVLFEDVLRKQLKEINSITRRGKEYEFSDANIETAILAVKDLPTQDGFINANAALYDLLTLGKAMEQSIDGDKKSHTLQYIDWVHPENNVFHVTEEFSVMRDGRADTFRPDIVLFINGIPTCVIECKTPSLSGNKTPTELAVEQHIRNFRKDGIRGLYVYSNLLMSIASNDGSYATTGTSKEFWAMWKEQFQSSAEREGYYHTLTRLKNQPLTKEQKDKLFSEREVRGFAYVRRYFDGLEDEERVVTHQDELLFSLCRPNRLLDLIFNFTLYDDGIKKIARYQQYFAVNETLNRVSTIGEDGRRKGGVIWHTQGSGKSLTMVMLAQMLATHPNIKNPKLLLVTDRIDLDDQISDTFKKCQKEVIQAKTGTHLMELLEEENDAIITTVINKFENAVKHNKKALTSANIFVLIDEGHRTQYGSFNVLMQRMFTHACFLAFTGTPLMKTEKNTADKFGGYIGVPYTVKDAVGDKAVVPLLYEGRHNLITVNEEPIDRYFEKLAVRENLTEYGKAALKRKFNTVEEINKADQVIYARAVDISEHYVSFFQTNNDKYKPKGQLVAPSIKAALKYHEYLKEIGQVTSEIVVTETDSREGNEDGYTSTNPDKEREMKFFEAMKDKYGDLKKYEKNVINQFKKQEHPEILIVVAKLLTGFDAPNNTILYLCKSMKEHTLLQAIARVNRVYPGKDYGYIIDYYGNLANLDEALTTYSDAGLADFDEKELEGTLTKLAEEVKKLPQAHSELWDIFKELRGKNLEPTKYEEHLKPEDRRHKFYEKLSIYSRLLKMALASLEFVQNTETRKIDEYKRDAKFFLKLRVDVKRRYNDDLSYKEFEPQIQKLIDKHLSTEGEVMKVTEMVNIFDKEERDSEVQKLTSDAAKADHIASRTIKAINLKMQEDPIYYKKLAELIKETVELYHQSRLSEGDYLQKTMKLEDKFFNGRSEDAPGELKENEAAMAFYNFSKTMYEDAELLKTTFHVEVSLAVDKAIKQNVFLDGNKIVDWKTNQDVLGSIKLDAGDEVYEVLKKFQLEADWKLIDNLVEECLKVAKVKEG